MGSCLGHCHLSGENFRFISAITNVTNKNNDNSELRLELLDDEWSILEEDEDEYLKSLDCKYSNQYTPASINSLELEWEHLPEMTVFSTNIEKEEPKSVTSAEVWSRISSADSLEWDHAQGETIEMKDDMDTETEQLLQEIEMLTTKTLQQTNDWTS
ncbi:conserved hypothetical protein [Pediculus humanus corporis]|uniref:Uncharacterized protein n=1 Tax=Pediculus humanus subsp. corporis TaxID=121224 RepID=E0VZ70_PEDHC|nr:uncharacterized protein Phum_PHUM527230 [Pediculus humanus corporis]EEB18676.1 conserved hypothetical protein [Pediculus humanus corporis]